MANNDSLIDFDDKEDEAVAPKEAETPDLKKLKRVLKTKLTKCRFELMKIISEDGKLVEVNKLLDCVNRLNDELSDCLDKLIESDSEHSDRYSKELDEVHEKCDAILTDATRYVCLQNECKQIEKRRAAANSTPASHEKVSEKKDTVSEGRPTCTIDRDMTHQLKRVSIVTFSGVKAEYRLFRDAFDECVDKSTSSSSYKMLQLRHHLRGDALRAIEGLPASEIGYTAALKKLDTKFGGQRRYLLMHLENVRTMRSIQAGDFKQLEDLGDKVELAVISLKENKRDDEFRVDSMFYCVVKSKMPVPYVADYKRWLVNENKSENIEALLEWLQLEITIRCEASEEGQRSSGHKPKQTHYSKQDNKSKKSDKKCVCCDGNDHVGLSKCPKFNAMPINDRWSFAKEKRCCFRCLAPGGSHRGTECRSGRICGIQGCTKTHNRLLHSTEGGNAAKHELNAGAAEFAPQSAPNPEPIPSFTHTAAGDKFIAMRIIPVIISNGQDEYKVNALLDECSTDSYISEHVAAQLDLNGEQTSRLVTVLGGKPTKVKGKRVSINLLRSTDRKHLATIESFTVRQVTGNIDVINWNEHRQDWSHLSDIEFPSLARPKQIDILIGLNDQALNLHSCLKEVHGRPGQPIARLTPLGWTCIGHITSDDLHNSNCHFIHSMPTTHFIGQEKSISDVLKRTWEIDNEGLKPIEMSPTETKLDSFVESKIEMKDRRYQVPIPWKDGEPNLPHNWQMAASRLRNLEKSLLKRPAVAAEYKRIFKDQNEKGYIKKLQPTQVNIRGEGWYLPHFPVVKPDKATTKVRIVMDAAARCDDKSLNDCIHQGPKLQRDLVDVLIRTRYKPVAISADISEMFLQIELKPEDRKYHRFLWRDMDVNKQIDVYEYNRLVFGNSASPYLSQKVIRTLANNNIESFPCGAEALLNAMYVDDLSDSVDNTSDAITLRKQVTELLGSAGFRIRKWISNNIDVLADIPESERATSVNIEDSELPAVKTLGLTWDAEADTYRFIVKVPTLTAMTKRSVFSASASLFDPLNFLSPYTIRAKILMQETWTEGLQWDDPLSDELRKKWETWFKEISSLPNIKIDRCMVLKTDKHIVRKILHTFVDASKDAYAAAIYLRTEYDSGDLSVKLVTSKARVAPLKAMSIPRLELCGAVLGLKLAQSVTRVLQLPMADVVYWTDSMNVLYWINGASRKYKPFVASRVGFIHEFSEPEQWNYVPTKMNSADLPTRGLTVHELETCNFWWNGPEFLTKSPEEWPKRRGEIRPAEEADSEIRSAAKTTLTSVKAEQNDLGRLHPRHFSDWTRLIRVTAWIRRFIKNCRLKKDKVQANSLTVPELDQAKTFWYKYAQTDAFAEEQHDLKSGHNVTKHSKLLTLNPCIDSDGVIRLDGRLKLGKHLPYKAKFPIILPREHDVTRLVIQHYDKAGRHKRGRNHLLSDTRTEFWVLRAREAIRAFQYKCPGCRLTRVKAAGQMMAPLPKFRLGDPLRCFARTGLDYAGPFITKQGRFRKRQKRYLCVFTCLASRAVHLEMAYSLDTDSFLNALSRFCDRRNRPVQILSDNGSNFVGAEHELKELISALDQDKIVNTTANRGIEWFFNSPSSPHFGGVFESMVKSAKRALKATMSNADLTDEELHTAITGAECLLNSRPLTQNSEDPLDTNVLTPNHFLFGQLAGQLAPESIEGDQNPRQRWRRVQAVISEFWKRWMREFLPNLQPRMKWQKPQYDFKVDDVVVVISQDSPRGTWPLGIITEIFPGPDGHVRVVNVRIGGKIYKRPIHRLYKLL